MGMIRHSKWEYISQAVESVVFVHVWFRSQRRLIVKIPASSKIRRLSTTFAHTVR